METLQERILHFMSQGNNPSKWFSSSVVQEGIKHDKKVTQPMLNLHKKGVLHRYPFDHFGEEENTVGTGRFLYRIDPDYVLPDELRKTTTAPTPTEVAAALSKDEGTEISVACETDSPTVKMVEELEAEQAAAATMLRNVRSERAFLQEEVSRLQQIRDLIAAVMQAHSEVRKEVQDRDKLAAERDQLEALIQSGEEVLKKTIGLGELPASTSPLRNQTPAKGVSLQVS